MGSIPAILGSGYGVRSPQRVVPRQANEQVPESRSLEAHLERRCSDLLERYRDQGGKLEPPLDIRLLASLAGAQILVGPIPCRGVLSAKNGLLRITTRKGSNVA